MKIGIFDYLHGKNQSKATEEKMSAKGVFKGYFLVYDCPLCGKLQNIDGYGQSILWIALKCIAKGEAITSCDNCEQHFKIPSTIFAEGILKEFDEVAQKPGDQLWKHVQTKYVENNNQMQILRLDWYDILFQANETSPVNVMTMPWDPKNTCPRCGSEPNSHPIAFRYACPSCGHILSIAQEDINQRLGVQVMCKYCRETHFIPPTVWCPKCQRNLIGYYEILRRIAEAHGVELNKVRLPL
ncbi:MAG: hypothetical protein CVT89_02605 [Candidatus Altiarchaeales archaeon HGW-Altiarchaeales-2]|nr:MAG: hypothetical protein CVT89_02605 [Candidatus Altiarchaeales archaeon HGW-Altiarchaeales-2]